MAPLHSTAKFDPFLSLDCAPMPSTLAQSKERKGSNLAIWQPWNKGATKKSAPMPTLSVHSRLLYPRLVDVMLKCVRSGRPMIHLVMAWAIVGPHLMEVSGAEPKFQNC